MAAIGEVDEANAAIGVAIAALGDGRARATSCCAIQNELFDLGADLATPGETVEGRAAHRRKRRSTGSSARSTR